MKKLFLAILILLLPLVSADDFMYQNMNENVNLYTGDIEFNLPLMTVYGRGGYDYNLGINYKSGILLNQKASEIGLGWDLNIPSITRSRINLPDDYLGGGVNLEPNIELRYEESLINENNGGSFLSKLFDAMGASIGSMQSPRMIPFAAFNALSRAMTSSEVNEVLRDCSGWCSLYTNGFKYTGVDSNQGVEVYNTYDSITPDFYTLNGDYLSGQIVLSSLPGEEHRPKFHFKKVQGNSNDDVDMDLCNPSNTEKCNDATNIEYSTNGENSYEKFFIQDSSGVSYIFEPTKSFVSNGDFVLHTWMTNEAVGTCSFSGEDYIETKYLKPYAYEFGMTALLDNNFVDVNGNGLPDDNDLGNWIRIYYDETVNDYHTMYPYDGTCIEGADGKMLREESYQELSFVSKVETPTHYAIFNYVYDREDSLEFGGSKKLPRLESITLYAKRDPNTILEFINFNQDYQLASQSPDSSSGKLTLREVKKEGLEREGSLPSISFAYSNPTLPWGKYKFDRWGYYYSEGALYEHNQDSDDLGGINGGVWSLKNIYWPSGASTDILYENDRYTRVNAWYGSTVEGQERIDTHFGGGTRVKKIEVCPTLNPDDDCDPTYYRYRLSDFTGVELHDEAKGYNIAGVGGDSSGVANFEPGSYTAKNDVMIEGSNMVQPYVAYSKVTVVPHYTGYNHHTSEHGWYVYEFTTAADFPNTGKYVPPNKWTSTTGEDYGYSVENGEIPESASSNDVCPFIFVGPKNHEIQVTIGATVAGTFTLPNIDKCNLYDTTPDLSCESLWFSWDKSTSTFSSNSFTKEIPESESSDKGTWRILLKDLDSANTNYIFIDYLEDAKDYHCCVDDNKDGICDLMQIPEEGKTSGVNDNDHARGLVKNITWYNTDGEIVKIKENVYTQIDQTNFGNGLVRTVWNRLDSTVNTVEGVSQIKEFEYNNLNGMISKITTRGLEGDSKILTRSFAYTSYPDLLLDKHMWSQVYQEKIYDNSILSSNLELQKTFTYSNILSPNSQWQWNLYQEKVGAGNEEKVLNTYEEYDDFGNVLKVVDGENNPSWFYYGDNAECGSRNSPESTSEELAHSYITCSENSLGQKTKFYYDLRANNNKTSGPNGLENIQEFNTDNNLKRTYENGNLVNELEYAYAKNDLMNNWYNTIKSEEFLDGEEIIVSVTTYDGLMHNVLSTVVGEDGNISVETDFDHLTSQVLSVSEPYYTSPDSFEVFTYENTPDPRIVSHKSLGSQFESSSEYLTNDLVSRKILVRDENNKVSEKTYDYFGNLVEYEDHMNFVTSYDYDILGNLIKIVNPLGEVSSYDYDTSNKLVEKINPESGAWTYDYNDNNALEYRTDARGITIRNWYDELNRLEKIDYPYNVDSVFYYDDPNYDAVGKIYRVTDASGETFYHYNSRGLLEREEISIEDNSYFIDYTYNNLGGIKTVEGPGISVVYNYNIRGLVDSILVNDKVVSVGYTASGKEESLDFDNGVSTSIFYNDRSWPIAISSISDSESVFEESYLFDSNSPSPTVGNLGFIYEGINLDNPEDPSGLNEIVEYVYDDNYRLRNADYNPLHNTACGAGPDCYDLSFTYDNFGNRDSINGLSYLYEDPRSESLLTDDGTYTYSYDENGNMLTKTHKVLGAVTSYSWNDNNMLESVEFPDGSIEEYVYDAKNRRVIKRTEAYTSYYVYDQFNNLIFEEVI